MKAAVLFSVFAIVAQSAVAEVVAKYECPNEFGYPVSLTIKKAAKGAFYPLSAQFNAPGKDATTGTLLRTKKIELQGSEEVIDSVKVYQLHNPADANHQVLAEIGSKGKKATVSEVHLREAGKVYTDDRNCTIK